ncbi:YgaP family membrane protein [Alkalicoccobacillus murimartini]|uniref:Inner membrane protein YgaP-like transmembrane domain-containing protein n=1 Tax=Alkalicoccobacillus murimartini TaxID=171685 RepID=A0ABT9YKS2_9BACI|nr:DUF2892 domain-containing protein [Alkalicoccobacillus murimartini]MDQ0208448.1 hypothetical protein [Alkalicoccobacillus murimartini]
MKPNLSRIQSLCRITCGLSVLAFASSKMQRKSSLIGIIGIIIGAMKVAEGITRFCPLIYMTDKKKQEHKQDGRVMNPS